MVQFTYLKLTGFKSFAESQDLGIADGLSGIVGPNGCGKSNIVEAMRWLMGESSAKAVRGDEIDDVIFAGTSTRPARNFAEVTLHINNSDGTIAAHADSPILEITRRLERSKGSHYTINGKPALARDVQLIFADLGISARSHSIISQGQVANLITAKPVERYGLLMDAAGTRGLQQRRGEASRRLNTAENNLTRIDDVLAQMNQQKQELAKQARQASRYRSIADRIRTAESHLFYVRYHKEAADVAEAEGLTRERNRAVASATETASAASRKKDTATTALPSLRERHAEASASQQRLSIEMQNIDSEEANIKSQQQEVEARLNQITADIAHETKQGEDATATIQLLHDAIAGLKQDEETHAPRLKSANQDLETARTNAHAADARLTEITAQLQSAQHHQETLKRQLSDHLAQKENAERDMAGFDTAGLRKKTADAKKALDQAEAAVKRASEASQAAAKTADTCRVEAQTAQAKQSSAEQTVTRMRHEIDTLTALLAGDPPQDNTQTTAKQKEGKQPTHIAAKLHVPQEFELAVAAVLEESLTAQCANLTDLQKTDSKQADKQKVGGLFWREDLPPLTPPLTPPKNSTPLLPLITTPPALHRALAGVGIVADSTTASKAQASLQVGQMLTTKQGGIWRWDGFVRKPHGSDAAAAERLRHSRRLQDLQEQVGEAEQLAESTRTHAEHCTANLKAAEEKLNGTRTAEAEANANLLAATSLAEQSQAHLAAEEAQCARLATTMKESVLAAEKLNSEIANLPSRDALAKTQTECQKLADQARTALTTAITTHATITKEHELRQSRQAEKTRELQTWQTRLATSQTRLKEFATREAEGKKTLANLATRPQELDQKRNTLATAIKQAQANHQKTGDALAEGETALAEAEVAWRQAETKLREAREAYIAQEGKTQTAQTILTRTTDEIAQKLNIAAKDLPELIGRKLGEGDDHKAEDEEALKKRTERLYRERDALGAVNLMAEEEMGKLAEEMEKLTAEETDLRAAITKLREGITRINKTGRDRLRRSFADVNRHFAEVFAHLFSGGKAELVLTDSDDPLVAGLEIIAQPPGKRAQSLALLSGGEQALTALALVFSVFLTNPAPICILDEVDAPLDDTNVARFCHLLSELTRTTTTRFIIITHHRMTMAHMDRLYGVTMQQAGVSQIVSVDLMEAEKYEARSA